MYNTTILILPITSRKIIQSARYFFLQFISNVFFRPVKVKWQEKMFYFLCNKFYFCILIFFSLRYEFCEQKKLVFCKTTPNLLFFIWLALYYSIVKLIFIIIRVFFWVIIPFGTFCLEYPTHRMHSEKMLLVWWLIDFVGSILVCRVQESRLKNEPQTS